ncbi:MAG: hypothetical protein AAGA30_07025 [Planctomycetota bacterium]
MSTKALCQFHNDLSAAVLAKVPLDLSTSDRTQNQISTERLEQIHNILSRDQSIEQLPDRLLAGWKIFQHTGLMEPVIEGLSVSRTARNELVESMAWTWRYMSLLIATAYGGLYFFSSVVAPIIVDLRIDSQKSSTSTPLSPEQLLPAWPDALPAIGVLLLILYLWGFCGGTKQWSLWLCGGELTNLRSISSAIKATRLLVASDVPLDKSVDLGCDLVGISHIKPELMEVDYRNLDQTISKMDQFSHLASNRLSVIRFRVPLVAVSLVGGLIALLYGVLIFQPISIMLQEIGSVKV